MNFFLVHSLGPENSPAGLAWLSQRSQWWQELAILSLPAWVLLVEKDPNGLDVGFSLLLILSWTALWLGMAWAAIKSPEKRWSKPRDLLLSALFLPHSLGIAYVVFRLCEFLCQGALYRLGFDALGQALHLPAFLDEAFLAFWVAFLVATAVGSWNLSVLVGKELLAGLQPADLPSAKVLDRASVCLAPGSIVRSLLGTLLRSWFFLLVAKAAYILVISYSSYIRSYLDFVGTWGWTPFKTHAIHFWAPAGTIGRVPITVRFLHFWWVVWA
jgi:hypothetical protein